jgi:hypothetical protein
VLGGAVFAIVSLVGIHFAGDDAQRSALQRITRRLRSR